MKIDIRLKIVLLLYANFLLLQRVSGLHEGLFMCVITMLFIYERHVKQIVRYNLVFCVLYMLEIMVLDKWENIPSIVSVIAIGFRLLLPCFIAGSFVLLTPVSYVMHGLRKWRVPENVLLTGAIMIRFLPSVKRDYQDIQQTLKLRGIWLTKWNIVKQPVRYFEYILVPLLMSSVRTAQDLTVASLTRAVGSQEKRTEYNTSTFGWIEYGVLCWISISIGCIILGVI